MKHIVTYRELNKHLRKMIDNRVDPSNKVLVEMQGTNITIPIVSVEVPAPIPTDEVYNDVLSGRRLGVALAVVSRSLSDAYQKTWSLRSQSLSSLLYKLGTYTHVKGFSSKDLMVVGIKTASGIEFYPVTIVKSSFGTPNSSYSTAVHETTGTLLFLKSRKKPFLKRIFGKKRAEMEPDDHYIERLQAEGKKLPEWSFPAALGSKPCGQ